MSIWTDLNQRHRVKQQRGYGQPYGRENLMIEGFAPPLLPEFFNDGVLLDSVNPAVKQHPTQVWPLSFARDESVVPTAEFQTVLVFTRPVNNIASLLVRLSGSFGQASGTFNGTINPAMRGFLKFNLLLADPDIVNATWNNMFYGSQFGEGHGAFYDTLGNFDDNGGGGEFGGFILTEYGVSCSVPGQIGNKFLSGAGSFAGESYAFQFDGADGSNLGLKTAGPYFGIHLFSFIIDDFTGDGKVRTAGKVHEQRPDQLTRQTNRRRGFALIDTFYE